MSGGWKALGTYVRRVEGTRYICKEGGGHPVCQEVEGTWIIVSSPSSVLL